MVKLASLGNSRYLLPCHQNNEQGLVWFVAFKKQKTQKIEEEGCVFDLSIQTHNCFQLEHTVILVWGSGKAVAPVKEKMLLGITWAPSQALLKLLKFVSHKICSHLHFILAENLIWKQISSSSLFTSEHNEWALAVNAYFIHRIRQSWSKVNSPGIGHYDGWEIQNADRVFLRFCFFHASGFRNVNCAWLWSLLGYFCIYVADLRFMCSSTPTELD